MLIHKPTNKVHNLRMNNTIAFCIDDPKFPFKRVRGKGTVKIHEDVSYDIPIAKKFIMKSIWSLNHPIAIWLLTEVEKGNEIILEITTMLLLFNLEKCSSNKIIKEYILKFSTVGLFCFSESRSYILSSPSWTRTNTKKYVGILDN